ncbi:MAG: TlpA family protein disulfide reductase [Nevskiales bacterium]|nr:TlpA family protein disulfide reductase [Nevskiales bacterium]
MKWRRAGILLVLCLVSAVGGFLTYRFWPAEPAGATVAAVRPDLQFRGLNGRQYRLSEWEGKLLLLNFWATWCTPCLKEIPLLVTTQSEYGARGFQIVGAALDQPESVQRFQQRYAINYPLLVGDADVVSAMEALGDTVGALPFSVLIAPDGKILERISGELSPARLQDWLSKYLST